MSFNKILLAMSVLVIVVLAVFFFKGPKSKPQETNDQAQTQTNSDSTSSTNTTTPMTDTEKVPDSAIATVETNLGSFEVTLNGKAAPKTVANFIKLSKDGFYNNLTFHRIVKQPGFHLIQGGDPAGNGSGGPGYTIPAEIGLKHTKGAIATARTGDQVNPEKASSGSQFYIVEEDIPFLDGNYTVFGYVTKGMDVVEKIGAVPTDTSDKPTNPVTIKSITIK
jgi:peptidyl-prolyl cis-trans isomerase B (cyclophilin B)